MVQMRFVCGSIMLALLAGVSAVQAADRDDWKRLGETLVKHRVERDEIQVGADEGKFRSIKLEVRGADVEIFKVTVVYSNGGDDTIEVRENIRQGGQTRAIDLKGEARHIRRVVLFYKTEAGEDRKARVILFGRN